MGELIFNGTMLVFFVVMLINSSQIAIWQDHYWAKYWPMMLLIIAVILFTIKVVGICKKLPKDQWKFTWEIFGFKNKNVRTLLLSFLWLIIYAAILPKLGFILATCLLCIGLEVLLGTKLSVKALLGALAITVIVYAIFTWGLRISVPRGVGPLFEFGKWLEYLWS